MPKLPVVFLAFANDKETAAGYLRNLTAERNDIREALAKAAFIPDPICELIIEPDVSIDRIFNIFQDERFRDRIAVFHYGGHADDYRLLLENSKGEKTTVHGDGLISFLANQNGLQLVFLNGCSTQQQAIDLVNAGIPAVIGTSTAIPDKLAQIIAGRFYRGLSTGLSIERAWLETDHRVRTENDQDIRGVRLQQLGSHTDLLWDIRYHKSSKLVREWNLPDAANNPIFGLPEIDRKYYLNLPPSPYLGLRRFEQQHAGIFFGRNSEIRKLIDKINGIYPIILYYGLSGVGKSSLLEAGLIPRIEKIYTVKVMRRIRDGGLIGTLKSGLNELIGSTSSNTSPTDLSDPILSYWKLVEQTRGKPLLFILDQAEESYTKPLNGEQDEWDTLCTAIKPLINHLSQSGSGKLILSFRSEYLPQIQNSLYNNTFPKTDLLLLPLNKTGIEEVIRGVTRNEYTSDNYHLSPDSLDATLAEEIAYDLSADKNSPVAPTLQIVLSKLWERSTVSKNGQRVLNKEGYRQIRDEGIALSNFVSERFTELQNPNAPPISVFIGKDVEESGLVLDLLIQFVTPKNTADAFGKERITALYPHRKEILQPLIDHLIDARLFTSYAEEETTFIGLSHDTLAPVIREFYEASDRPGQRARRILEGKVLGGQEESILDELDLAQVERGIEGMRTWTTEEQQLIKSSRIARQKRINQQKRRRALTMTFVSMIFLFGLISVFLWQRASKKTYEAETNRLVSRAQLVFAKDQTLGVNLALEAVYRQLNRETGLTLSSMIGDARGLYQTSFTGHKGGINSVAISPEFILTGGADNKAKLWNLDDGTLVDSFMGHKGQVLSVAFSRDGKYALTGSADFKAKLWNLDGTEVDSFVGHRGQVLSVDFSPDGKYVLTGSLDRTAKLWNLNGTEVVSFAGHHAVASVAFSPDGKYVLTGGGEGTMKLWNLDGTEVDSSLGHASEVLSAAFSPDGKYILIGSEFNIPKLWNLDGTLVDSFIGHEAGILSVAFSPTGKQVLTGSRDGTAKLWNLDGTEVASFFGHTSEVLSVAFSPRGNNVLTGSRDGTAKLWKLGPSFEVASFIGHEPGVLSVAFSSNGNQVLTGSWDGTAKLWQLDGAELASFIGHNGHVNALAFSPLENNYVLLGNNNGTVKLWNLNNPEVNSIVWHEDEVKSVAFSPDGKHVLTGNQDGIAKMWTLDGTKVSSFVGHKSGVESVAFSPDGHHILTGSSDWQAKLWKLDGTQVDSFVGHEYGVESVAFSPDGKYVLTGSTDMTAKLWKLDGTEVVSFVGHEGEVKYVAFSPDGKFVLTGSGDFTAKLWSMNGAEIQSFVGHKDPVMSVAFSPDGRQILTGTSMGSIKLWLRWDYFRQAGILPPLTLDQRNYYEIE